MERRSGRRWCNPHVVTHSRTVLDYPKVTGTPHRCRQCSREIGRGEPFYRCCVECRPLCGECFPPDGMADGG